MEIFSLVGKIMVDSAEAESSIQKTGDEAEKTGNKLTSGIGKAAKWAAGIGASATAACGAMIKAAKGTAEDLDVIDKASIRMGIAAESYQELAYAAGLSGVEMSTMERAAKKLEGTDLNLDEALDQIMQLGTEEERTAAASELFGESVAYQMEPLLKAGADGMAAMRQEANDLGLVMSQEAVSNGAAMNDMFSKVGQSLDALKNQLIIDLMPYIMTVLDWVIQNIPKIKDTVKRVLDMIIPIVKPVIDTIMSILPPIMDAVQKLLDWLIPAIRPILDGIRSLFDGFKSLFNGDIEGFFNGIFDFIGGLASSFLNIGSDILNWVWSGLTSVWQGISSWVSDKVSWLIDKLAFWRKGSNEIGGGESHAGGLPYVPYDNYPARLHRGESVMTAADSQSLLQSVQKIAANGGGGGPITITVNSVLDGKVIGKSVTTYQRNMARAMG